MRHPSNLPRRSIVPLAAAAIASGAVPGATAAHAGSGGCIAPDVVGVSLSMARGALSVSGCAVQLHQLPAHGEYVTPESADGRQIVARQSPAKGARTAGVTVWLKPLCRQPEQPGPERRGPASNSGPTELIVGLYLRGGPPRTAPSCRRATPAEGTLTVSTPGGEVLVRRLVHAGRYGVFPLKPGRYVVIGSPSGAVPPPAQEITISARRTTHVNVVGAVR